MLKDERKLLIDAVNRHIDMGYDLNLPVGQGKLSPIHIAIRECDLEAVRLFIDKGARIDSDIVNEVLHKSTCDQKEKFKNLLGIKKNKITFEMVVVFSGAAALILFFLYQKFLRT